MGNEKPLKVSQETEKTLNRPKLLNFVRKLVAEDEAEDLLQDVLASVFTTPSLIDSIENLTAYLFRALRNRATDQYRGKKESMLSLNEEFDDEGGSLLDWVIDPRPQAPDEMIRRDLFSGLERALDQLEEEDQELIRLTELGQHTIDSLAKQRQVPLGTLLSRKSRAMAKLKVLLDDEDIPFPFLTQP